MAINAVSNYNSALNYQNWVDNATADAKALESSLKANAVSETESTEAVGSTAGSSTSSSTVSSATSTGTSSFLLSYKRTLEDLESVSEQLRVGSKNNVFAKYESALEKLENAGTDEEREAAQAAVDSAKKDIVSAVKEFAEQYNDTISFLESNSDRSKTVENQLKSMQRALSTEGALATVGLSLNASGELQLDEEKLNEALDVSYASVKETLGGQFGIAERAATRATQILDHASIESIAGTTDESSISDFTLFANFAKGGRYNLSNFYAVGALLNTLV